jgi:divalent metal cation (Fe/Co/Zn/Cd) transporter
LIHNRIHRQTAPEHWRATGPNTGLNRLSAIFTLLITIPAVAFTVYSICKWLEVEETKSKVIALVLGLASFFVELGLILISSWKDEKKEDRAAKRARYRPRRF